MVWLKGRLPATLGCELSDSWFQKKGFQRDSGHCREGTPILLGVFLDCVNKGLRETKGLSDYIHNAAHFLCNCQTVRKNFLKLFLDYASPCRCASETQRLRDIAPQAFRGLRALPRSDAHIVPDVANWIRHRWFIRYPQKWLHDHGVTAAKPLHRLRGLYADHIAKLTQDAVAAQMAAIRAAQSNLGHTSSATTERHYLTPDALR